MIVDGEDGISVSEALTKQQVIDRVEENYYGFTHWTGHIPKMGDGQFECPSEAGPVMRSEIRIGVIIKGKVVEPKPKQTYELD